MTNYIDNYLLAIENPLPQLRETFQQELQLLYGLTKASSDVLDIGCGAGRPTKELASKVRSIIGIDYDKDMLHYARKRCFGVQNASFVHANAHTMPFANESFDLAYATYNLIGSLPEEQRVLLIKEMGRISRGKIVNLTWKDDETTTRFLQEYYSGIGIELHDLNSERAITSKGTFSRISISKLFDYHTQAGIHELRVIKADPLWVGVVGQKQHEQN